MRSALLTVVVAGALFIPLAGTAPGQDSAGVSPSAAAPAKATAAPIFIPFKGKTVVFTMALGTDPATSAKLTAHLAYWLRWKDEKPNPDRQPQIITKSWVVPEPNWTLNDLIEQCRRDENALGAFIVQPPGIASGNTSRLIYRRSWSTVALTVVTAECRHNSPPTISPGPQAEPTLPAVVPQTAGQIQFTGEPGELHMQLDAVPAAPKASATPPPVSYIWASESQRGDGEVKTATALFPLAALVTLYTALAPSRTITTVRTVAFPTTPLPPSGALSSIATTNTTVTNSGSAGSAGSTFVTAFLTYTNTVAALPNSDAQLDSAGYNATYWVVDEMKGVECGKSPKGTIRRPSFCDW